MKIKFLNIIYFRRRSRKFSPPAEVNSLYSNHHRTTTWCLLIILPIPMPSLYSSSRPVIKRRLHLSLPKHSSYRKRYQPEVRLWLLPLPMTLFIWTLMGSSTALRPAHRLPNCPPCLQRQQRGEKLLCHQLNGRKSVLPER